MKEILSWIEVIVIAIVLALFLNNFVIVNATVPSGSMENTIQPGDRLIGFRFSYWFSDPKRGDIVVFRYPIDEALGKKTNYIKRIIGLPGETIEIKNSKIYINGSETPLEEDYLKEKWTVMNDGFTFEVPEGCYLMLGDNRNDSSDARYWASKAYAQGVASTEEEAMSFSYVKKDKILGKAYFRYWPLTQISSLY
ncbi:MAG: signal peptidase I [Lachnospiraceae bacterium]|nr:signal peptidase I [Lachnospiraceae bacterium]